jgi:hypothetical protein
MANVANVGGEKKKDYSKWEDCRTITELSKEPVITVDPFARADWLRVHGGRLRNTGLAIAAIGLTTAAKAVYVDRSLGIEGPNHSRWTEIGTVLAVGGTYAYLGGKVNVDTAASIEAGKKVGMGIDPDYVLSKPNIRNRP